MNYNVLLLLSATDDYLAFSPEVVDFAGTTIINNMGRITDVAFHVLFIVLGIFIAIKLVEWLSS